MASKFSPPTQDELSKPRYSADTRAVHADDYMNTTNTDVAPPLHVATTYRYAEDPKVLRVVGDEDVHLTIPPNIYSRLAQPNTTRLESILSSLCHGHALTYSSGLSAFHAMLVYYRPRVIAISDGYHGCHGVIAIMKKLYRLKVVSLWDEQEWDEIDLREGDIIHVETPLNPSGEAINLLHFRELATKRGALLTVDSTFGPPGLQDPFVQGADCIMHSGTKYFGGHSDMLCGVLVVPPHKRDVWERMWKERMYLGSVMGNMEGWLGVRSLRTLELRVARQSESTTKIVEWLSTSLAGEGDDALLIQKVVERIQHASLQKEDMEWICKQMPGGYGPVFVIWMKSPKLARFLPSKLALFHHATSLGGVESLIEWRRMSDLGVDERVLRVSVGVENWEDLREDLREGFSGVEGLV
ncbi:PLP-dependent transferase [Tothia fuscella]|uniref:PLP-dependent transferase n=1 Tax=Tothia fuscella TaxID=1048955 RepID=A0A9P4TXB4_9PEZI|nr:PLP-dependent transferase [Tothia fuscella]